MKLALLGIVGFLSSLAACSERGEAASVTGSRRIVDSSGGTVALGIAHRPYRVTSDVSGGAIDGRITRQGATTDSVVRVAKDTAVCGDSAAMREGGSDGGSLANVLVWVDGVQAGKPLPEVRRETLTIERCRFTPRVMAVVSRTTINLFSRDRAQHRPTFYREGEADPIERMRTVDEGQVIPSEKIASEPGIVEVRCAEHPFARAYIAVFDHPYFAVTDSSGAFRIDGLPAGTYTVKVWQERLAKPVEQRVAIAPGGAGRLDLALALK